VVIRAARRLADAGCPACVEGEDAHWGATLDAAADHLGRRLSAAEITALSAGRQYGPIPVLSWAAGEVIAQHLFPRGNSTGCYYDWPILASELEALVDAYQAVVDKVKGTAQASELGSWLHTLDGWSAISSLSTLVDSDLAVSAIEGWLAEDTGDLVVCVDKRDGVDFYVYPVGVTPAALAAEWNSVVTLGAMAASTQVLHLRRGRHTSRYSLTYVK